MKKGRKLVLTIVSVLICLVLIVLSPIYFLFLHRYKGSNVIDIWSKEDVFDINDITTIVKKKDEDFVILNLADIQLCDLEDIPHFSTIHREITYLVEKIKPDLITLTGDQTWSNENLISLKSIISWLDRYKIPYAPVFGNHDYGNGGDIAVASQNYCCDLYEKGKYSLFKRGPSNLGSYGNYVINITEDGKIYKTLYMMDLGYGDSITDMQKEWLEWNAEGIRKYNSNKYSEGMCFMHKPIPEYAKAYEKYIETGEGNVGEVYCHFSLYGSKQNGFFETLKDNGVLDIVCGHQHGNSFTLFYDDVRLTFALKTGEMCSYVDDGNVYLNGASIFILGQEVKIERAFVEKDKFHISDKNNIYFVEE